MRKVIILNGPPNSGKDEIAKYLVNKYNGKLYLPVIKKEFKTPLIELTKKFYDLSDAMWAVLSQRDFKETPFNKLLHGMSPRKSLIHVSENVIKPVFGDNIFGKLAFASLEEGINIFSDGGFPEEVSEIIKGFGDWGEVVVVRVKRDGCNFSNDSRRYLTEDMFDKNWRPHFINVENKEGKMVECAEEIFHHCLESIWRL